MLTVLHSQNCHEFNQSIQFLIKAEKAENFPLIDSSEQIELDPDGRVDIEAVTSENEHEFLDKFGCVIFEALDFGNGEDEEPDLPEELGND